MTLLLKPHTHLGPHEQAALGLWLPSKEKLPSGYLECGFIMHQSLTPIAPEPPGISNRIRLTNQTRASVPSRLMWPQRWLIGAQTAERHGKWWTLMSKTFLASRSKHWPTLAKTFCFRKRIQPYRLFPAWPLSLPCMLWFNWTFGYHLVVF